MPQTSPMNWTILSLLMILSILNVFSLSNEKANQKAPSQKNFNLNMTSWKW